MRSCLFNIPFISEVNKDRCRGEGICKPFQSHRRIQVFYIACKPVASIAKVIGKITESQYSGQIGFTSEPFGFELQIICLKFLVLQWSGIGTEIIIINIKCKFTWKAVPPKPYPSVFICKLRDACILNHFERLWFIFEIAKWV